MARMVVPRRPWNPTLRRRLRLECLGERVCPSAFYDLSVVAQTGTGAMPFVSLGDGPSINDNGFVAFVGRTRDASDPPGLLRENVFALNPVTGGTNQLMNPVFAIPNGGTAPNQTIHPQVQINNQNLVLARRHLNAVVQVGFDILTAPLTYLEKWDATQTSPPGGLPESQVAMGDGGVGPAWPLLSFLNPVTAGSLPSPFVANSPFAGLFRYAGMNNSGQTAFGALLSSANGGTNQLVTAPHAGQFTYLGIGTPGYQPQPMIADTGTVVLRNGTETIVYALDFNLGNIQQIAGSANQFTRVGLPAISDDGKVVAFAGDRGRGPGIFVSVDMGNGTRRLEVIAGENSAAAQRPELGYSESGAKLFLDGFDFNRRLGVVHQDLGPAGLEGDTVLVTFVADANQDSRPNPTAPGERLLFSDALGVWTARLDILAPRAGSGTGPLVFNTASPQPVVQVGDRINGEVVTAVSLFDPLVEARFDPLTQTSRIPQRGDHVVAFWAETTAGQYVVRAAHVDTDADGLLDHWERNGIDVNGDGAVDLNLPALGSSPNRRDVFLEIDWLRDDAATGRTFAPQLEAINFLVAMFAAAPDPIVLHVDAGLGLSFNMGGGPLLHGGGQQIDYAQVLYFGVDGTQTFAGQADTRYNMSRPVVARSYQSVKDVFFGTADRWARELAFHYSVFCDLSVGSDPASPSFNNFAQIAAGGSSGLAEASLYPDAFAATNPNLHLIPGNDHMVSLQGDREYDTNGNGTPDVPDAARTGRVEVPVGFLQGNTLAHEFGHTFGLIHGGLDFGVNFSGYGLPQYRSLMSYLYQLTPDASGVLVRDYSRAAGPGSFDDWSYLRMDFASYFDNLGTSFGYFRGAAPPDLPELNPVAVLGPLDHQPPTVAILSPLPGAAVPAGGTVTVVAAAADNLGLNRVEVTFDLNGNGAIDAGETALAVPVGGGNYQAVFTGTSGPAGVRTVLARAVDSANFTTATTVPVQVGGTATVGVSGVQVNASQANGTQRSRVTAVTVTFTAQVTFVGPVADAFDLSRIGGGAVGGFTATASVVGGVTVVTLSNFTGAETQFGSLADGRYSLTVRANQIVGGFDGNGDGTAGDDYSLNGSVANGLYRLYGDANADGVINAVDFGQFRGAFGTASGDSAYRDFLDIDGDGFINAFDFAQFRTRFGSGVP